MTQWEREKILRAKLKELSGKKEKKEEEVRATEAEVRSSEEKIRAIQERDIDPKKQDIESKKAEIKSINKQEIEFTREYLATIEAREAPFGESRTLPISGRKNMVLDLCEDILQEVRPEPIHFREITKEIQKREEGILSDLTNPEVYVRTVLTNASDRFVRPRQVGMYALKKDYPDISSVGRRK